MSMEHSHWWKHTSCQVENIIRGTGTLLGVAVGEGPRSSSQLKLEAKHMTCFQ
jgi:hypothetical protein